MVAIDALRLTCFDFADTFPFGDLGAAEGDAELIVAFGVGAFVGTGVETPTGEGAAFEGVGAFTGFLFEGGG